MFTMEVENLSKRFLLDHRPHLNLLRQLKDKANLNNPHFLWALKNINFKVEKGDCIGIIGENGAGKSTLLKILSGVILPTDGHFAIGAQIISGLDYSIIFKSELTARENIYLSGCIMGLSTREIKQKFEEIIQFSELKEFINTKLKFFSWGMKIRLGISISLAIPGEILLFDEFIVGADAEFRNKCYTKLEQLRKEGMTILFATHWLSLVKKYCNKILFISHGKQLYFGNIEDFFQISQKFEEFKKIFQDKEVNVEK